MYDATMAAFVPGNRLSERRLFPRRDKLICHRQVTEIRDKAGVCRTANSAVWQSLDGVFLRHHLQNLLKRYIAVITGVAGLCIQPFPFAWGVKRPACQLPVKQVHLFSFVTIRFDNNIFAAPSDSLDPQDCRPKIVVMQIVKGVQTDDQIKGFVCIREVCSIA